MTSQTVAGTVVEGEAAAVPASLTFDVYGTPAPQGSKRHVGHGVLVESSKKVKPWRESVKWAAIEAKPHEWRQSFDGPVHVAVTFRFPRPKFHFRTGKNAHLLRENAPVFPSGRPDLDKCLRSTLDALGEAGVFKDDAQVVLIGAMKCYADKHPVGAHITVTAMP